MVILPSGVINVLWLMVQGAEFVEISSCSSPIHADFLVNLGRYGPCPPCPREAPSLPPSVDPRNVLFSTSAWIFATWLPQQWKKGGQSVYQRSPEWGQDLLHVFVTCWKTAGKHQTTRTPASKLLPCSGCAQMKVGIWTEIKDGFRFRPIFVVVLIHLKITA